MPTTLPATAPWSADATVLIPLRAGGKQRLAPGLGADARWSLCVAMLDDVLAAVRDAGVDDVRIVAAGEAAVEVAEARGLHAIRDRDVAPGASPTERLRMAVDDALATVDRDTTDAAGSVRIVLAADLPLISPHEITELLATSDRVTVAPTRDGGTGALVLPAGATIPTQYGRGSAAAHLSAARAAGLDAIELERTGLAVDVDAAVDLRTVIAIARMGTAPGGARCGEHTATALTALGLLDESRVVA
jgi:2-phospho-L-lactate/phosphoenolpyruvate guanylyltransferase